MFIIAEGKPSDADHQSIKANIGPSVILQLRLYALYFRDKRILALTTFVCVGAALSAAYVMGRALYFITGLSPSSASGRGPIQPPYLQL